MKYLFFLILCIGIRSSLYSQEQTVVFHQQDGSTKVYKMSDVESFNFIKSDTTSWMYIYQNDLPSIFKVKSVDSLNFSPDNQSLNVCWNGQVIKIDLSKIDKVEIKKEKLLNDYECITIGNQVWMLRNLDVDHYRDGEPIYQINNQPEWQKMTAAAWCYYNFDSTNGEKYGRIYNGYCLGSRHGLVPEGWHVATDGEWKELEIYLGMIPEEANTAGWRGLEENTGGKLKETGTINWLDPNVGATNESGFTALPGGGCNTNGVQRYIGEHITFWTYSKSGSEYAVIRRIYSGFQHIYRVSFLKRNGCYIRCVRD